MKLRNKKTGEITQDDDWDFVGLVLKVDHIEDAIEMDDKIEYHSLAELNEEWEDYNPVEPLIKDKELRDSIRLWAKYYNIDTLRYKKLNDILDYYLVDNYGYLSIDVDIDYLKIDEAYTITELCGSEE